MKNHKHNDTKSRQRLTFKMMVRECSFFPSSIHQILSRSQVFLLFFHSHSLTIAPSQCMLGI